METATTAVMRKAIDETVKSQNRTPAVYPITTSACCIPRSLTGIHGVWTLHLDRDFFYAAHAERLDHLKPTEDMLHYQMGLLVQVFGNLAQRMFRKIGAQHKTVATAAKKKAAPKKKKARKVRKTGSDDDDDDDADDDDESGESDESDDDEVVNVRTYGDGFQAQSSATAPVQVFIETTMRNTKAANGGGSDPFNLKSKITGLRFWIFSFDRTLSLDDCLADMLEANQAEAQSRTERQAKGFDKKKDASIIEAYDWWRRVAARSDWMALCDLNTRHNYCGSNSTSEFSKMDELRQGRVPYSMTNSFAFAFALHNVSADTVRSQSLLCSPAHYVQRSFDEQTQKWLVKRDASGAFSFEWPLAEYVNRVQPPLCTADGFFCRYWPDYQQRRMHPLVSIFPSLSGGGGDAGTSASSSHHLPDYDFDNPAFAGASAEVRTITARHVDIGAHQRRLDEETRLADEEAVRRENEILARLGCGGGGGDDDNLPAPSVRRPKRPRQPRTRKDALFQHIQALGLPNFDERIERFDRRSLAPLARLFEIAQKEWAQFETYFYASPFALLHREAANLRVLIARKLRETRRLLKHPEMSARCLHLIAQIQSLCGYVRSCRAPDSLISEVGRLLHTNRMVTNIYKPEVHQVRPFLFDLNLGAFATRVAIENLDLAKVFGAASNVVHTGMMRMVAHDAYRHTYDMHVNVIHYGDGGAGKSFVLELLENVFLIEGTVKKLQRETACADSVDGDGNDTITIFHELQMNQFAERRANDSGGASSSSESSFKEKLTSMQVRVAIPVLNADGTREQRIIVRSAIGVWLGNTNSDIFDVASGAMRSRFHLKGFPVGPDDVNEIIASKLREVFKTGELSLKQKQIQREMHLLQILHYELEKMFHVGALTTPSLHVGMVLHKMVMTVLKRHGVVAETVRFYQRTVFLMRLLCITEALYDHYLRPGAPYLGREITPDSFLSLDARLFVQTPQVVWALGLVEDQILPPHDIHVLRALERMIAASPAPSTYGLSGIDTAHQLAVSQAWKESSSAQLSQRVSKLSIDATTMRQSPGFQVLSSFMRSADDSENSMPATCEPMRSAAAPAAEADSRVRRDANNAVLDASYRSFAFKGLHWEGFVEAVRTSCAAVCEGRTMPSTTMIQDTLRRLQMRNYASHRYAFASPYWPELTPEQRNETTQNNAYIVVLPEENASALSDRPVFVRNSSKVCILASYLHETLKRAQESSESLMISALRECLNKRHQLKAVYAYGQEVEDNAATVKMLLLGPDCTPAEVEAVEGYWRTAYRAATQRQSALNGGGLRPPPATVTAAAAVPRATRQLEMMMPNPGFTERAVRLLECSLEKPPSEMDGGVIAAADDDPTIEQARVHRFEMEIDQWGAMERCSQLMITGDAVPRAIVLGQNNTAVDDGSSALLSRLNAMSVEDREFEDVAERRLREERDQDGSQSIHVEGHSYYFGVEVLNDLDHPLGINPSLREDRNYEELSKAADNFDIVPDESGEDFDFNEHHYYVPVPRERILESAPPHLLPDELAALRQSVLYSDPNAVNTAEDEAEEEAEEEEDVNAPIIWVPHWLYMGMPREVYKIVRYVWTIEGARQRLWQEFSGHYENVRYWSYPGDLAHDQRNPNNNELWRIVMDSTHPLHARSARAARAVSTTQPLEASAAIDRALTEHKLSRVRRVHEWIQSSIKMLDLSAAADASAQDDIVLCEASPVDAPPSPANDAFDDEDLNIIDL